MNLIYSSEKNCSAVPCSVAINVTLITRELIVHFHIVRERFYGSLGWCRASGNVLPTSARSSKHWPGTTRLAYRIQRTQAAWRKVTGGCGHTQAARPSGGQIPIRISKCALMKFRQTQVCPCGRYPTL